MMYKKDYDKINMSQMADGPPATQPTQRVAIPRRGPTLLSYELFQCEHAGKGCKTCAVGERRTNHKEDPVPRGKR